MVDFWASLEVSLIIRNTKQVKYYSSKQFITTKSSNAIETCFIK